VNKVKIEANSDGKTYVLTLPGGGQRHCLSAEDVVKCLKHAAQEFQNALNDIKTRQEEFEKKAAKA
jgi:hypothetical protein